MYTKVNGINVTKKAEWKSEREACTWVVCSQLYVVHDITQGLGALLHLGQLGLAQFLTDKVRDSLLADADRDAEEDLVRDAVPAFRQSSQREHAPLQYTRCTVCHCSIANLPKVDALNGHLIFCPFSAKRSHVSSHSVIPATLLVRTVVYL